MVLQLNPEKKCAINACMSPKGLSLVRVDLKDSISDAILMYDPKIVLCTFFSGVKCNDIFPQGV